MKSTSTESEIQFTNSQALQQYYLLYNKYGRATINKEELSLEMSVSQSTINTYISKGYGIPNYFKIGTSRNASVRFNLIDVAEFLSQTIKTS